MFYAIVVQTEKNKPSQKWKIKRSISQTSSKHCSRRRRPRSTKTFVFVKRQGERYKNVSFLYLQSVCTSGKYDRMTSEATDSLSVRVPRLVLH